jgi:hypothetical protein
MTSAQLRCLKEHRERIVQDVDPQYILDYLIGDSVIDDEERQRIENGETTQEKCRRLLGCLLKKDSRAYETFVVALVKEKYAHIAVPCKNIEYDLLSMNYFDSFMQ